MFVGLNGYVESTRAIIRIVKELKAMPHICVVGDALLSVVAFSSKDFNIYLLYDAMSERGWSLSPLQFPLCIHITVTRHQSECKGGNEEASQESYWYSCYIWNFTSYS